MKYSKRHADSRAVDQKTSFDPVTDIARGNCPCGKWFVIPRGKTVVCKGPCHSGKECGRVYYWKDGKIETSNDSNGTQH